MSKQEGGCYRSMKGRLATDTYVIRWLPCGLKESFLEEAESVNLLRHGEDLGDERGAKVTEHNPADIV